MEDESKKTIAVFPGKFKPPHKDHIARIKAASADADEVIVIVSPKTEPGGTAVSKKKKEELEARLGTEMPITLEQSLELFKKLNLPSNIKVIAANDPSLPVPSPSPVSAAYELFINNPQQQYIAVFGKEEDLNRFGQTPQNVTVKNYSGVAGNLSATDLRTAAPEVVKAKKDEMLELYKGVKEFIAQQPASPAAEEWIAKEMQSADRLPVPKNGAEMTPHPELHPP